jgi:AAA domain
VPEAIRNTKRWQDRWADLPRVVRDIYRREAFQRIQQVTNGAIFLRDAPAQVRRASGLWADDLADIDAPIPLRDWLVKHYLLRKHITTLFGVTAEGKSTLAIMWAVAMALPSGELPCIINRFVTFGGLRVLIYSLEEDQTEQRRRIRAALQIFRKPGTALGGRLISTGCDLMGTLFHHDPRVGEIRKTGLFHQLRAAIQRHRPDVVIFDPMVELHTAPENDNALMRWVTAELRALARELGIAILLLHHAPKGDVIPGDITALRGAGAIGGAVRFGYTVVRMSEEEAKECGISEVRRGYYFRVDKAKGSYSPPISDAEWFSKVGCDVDGEEVGAVRPCHPHDAKEATNADVLALVADIQAGCPEAGGEPWSPKPSYTYARDSSLAEEARVRR